MFSLPSSERIIRDGCSITRPMSVLILRSVSHGSLFFIGILRQKLFNILPSIAPHFPRS